LRSSAGGIVVLPASLIAPLLEAQGNRTVFGSIGIDEFNAANIPTESITQTKALEDARSRAGFVVDKFCRSLFQARVPAEYGFYGANDVLRDHYEDFYAGLASHTLVRCKHYCVSVPKRV
jgi:hypothetical protein